MSITIAGAEFDGVEYDARGDVLYLSVGAPREPARTLETSEGHAVDYDEAGRVVGMVLLNVRWTLDRKGELHVTLPEHAVVAERQDLEPALR
jgi:YD repeat-containing protein